MTYLEFTFADKTTMRLEVPANRLPIDMLKQIEDELGVWNGNTFYPWHSIARVDLVVR